LTGTGLDDITVRLSDRRFLAALAQAAGIPAGDHARFFIILDKLDKIGWDGVRGELSEAGIPRQACETALDMIAAVQDLPAGKLAGTLAVTVPGLADEIASDLAATATCLERLAVTRPLAWQFDPALVRGMGYYTGQVFEVTTPGSGGSVAGGGRYDKLIGRWLGRDVPACGFSIGFERIVDLLHGSQPPRDAVAVLAEPGVHPAVALAVARDLREQGRVTEVIRRSGKLPAQLARLEAAGFTSYLLMREDDAAMPQPRPLGGESPHQQD
jgi:histidyl-tRNA synthetase